MENSENVYRFAEHMPEGDVLTLIVLKGNLLIESKKGDKSEYQLCPF
jgi:hypothetical protein